MTFDVKLIPEVYVHQNLSSLVLSRKQTGPRKIQSCGIAASLLSFSKDLDESVLECVLI